MESLALDLAFSNQPTTLVWKLTMAILHPAPRNYATASPHAPGARRWRVWAFAAVALAAAIFQGAASTEAAAEQTEFARIPSGSFTMGSPSDEPGRAPTEAPQHSVTFSRGFYLARTPVTWEKWTEVREWALANGYNDLTEGLKGSHGDERNAPDEPVTMVSWWDALKWLNARSELEKRVPVYYTTAQLGADNVFRTGEPLIFADWSADGYRLPTEAEWEYACRAGTTTAFYTGPITHSLEEPVDPNLDLAGWYAGNSEKTHPTGQKQPNAWGLYDMHGNVWEWCWNIDESYRGDAVMDPVGPLARGSANRIRRGGSWAHNARLSRSAARLISGPFNRFSSVGFRAALSHLEPRGDPSAFRTWKDGDERVMEARLLNVEDERVRLLRRDGRAFWIPIEDLSAESRRYLDSLLEIHGAGRKNVSVYEPTGLAVQIPDLIGPDGPRPAPEVLFVKLYHRDFDQETFMTAVIQGLANRKLKRPSVFTLLRGEDPGWARTIQEKYPHVSWHLVEPGGLLDWAKEKDLLKGQVFYDPEEEHSVNTVMMLCAVRDAIPVTEDAGLPTLFDARGKWADEIEAGRWAQRNLLSAMNRELFAIQKSDTAFLKDFLVDRKVFTIYGDVSKDGPRRDLFLDLIDGRHFNPRTAVLGYHRWDGKEIVNELTRSRTQLGVWSDWASNLSFYSQFPPVKELKQPPKKRVRYDPEKTYVALVVSDGDNIQLNLGSIRLRFDERGKSELPISWTISNWMMEYAPPVLEWYFEQALARGNDSFLMGPSGHAYVHPSINPDHEWFAWKTRQNAAALDMEGYVHFDRYDNRRAMTRAIQAFPGRDIRGVFSPIHPPVADWIGDVCTFREWYRLGIGNTSVEELARRLNADTHRGQLGYAYVIHFVSMDQIEKLPALLEPHVELVGYRELIDLAWQKRSLR